VFHGKEKYGRELVDIYDNNDTCINDVMVNEGFAIKYNGGKKTI
jgi:endonuclease YncB( thermonuclease family)